MQLEYTCILYEKEDNLAIITFNRPHVRNALNRVVMEEFGEALDSAEADPDVRALIITGAGDRAFVSGSDITELRGRTTITEIGPISRQRRGVLVRLEHLYKPSIAAINGAAIGGGCEIALACTIRIAADTALLGQPEVNLGIIPGFGATQRLARLIGKGRAMEMILTGDPIDAQEAHRIGLVNRVVPGPQLMETAKALGRKFASKPPLALRAAKDAIDYGLDTPLSVALEFENRLWAILCGTEDKTEGIDAFLEKRSPVWRGQ